MPTVGFAREVVKQDNTTITYFDLGGGERIRGIWPKYYAAVCNSYLDATTYYSN